MASEWRELTIGDLCDAGIAIVQTGPFGSQLHANEYLPQGVPVVPTEAIRNRQIDWSVLPRISKEKAQTLSRHLLQVGDILFARRGIQATGHIGYVRQAEQRMLCGTGAILLRVKKPCELDSEFLSHVLADPRSIEWFKFHAVGATMPNLNDGIIRSFRLTLPRIEEQRRIAVVLSALDDRIEQGRGVCETLEAIARAIFKSWFVDFDPVRAKAEGREPEGMDADTAALFPSEFRESELGEIPLGWTVREVRDVSTSNRKSIGKNFAHDEIEYVDISSVEPGRITTSTMCNLAEAPSRAKRLVSDGDTIWSCVRPNRRSFALMMEPANNLVVSTGFVTLTATEVPFSFLYLSVTTSHFVEYLTLRADGAAYPAVRPDTFESAKVIVPSANILNRFHEIAEPMLRKIAANNEQAKTLATLRDTLLPRLISGKLRVPEAEKLVEAVV